MKSKYTKGDVVMVVGKSLTGSILELGCIGVVQIQSTFGYKPVYLIDFNFKNNIGLVHPEENMISRQWWVLEEDLGEYRGYEL